MNNIADSIIKTFFGIVLAVVQIGISLITAPILTLLRFNIGAMYLTIPYLYLSFASYTVIAYFTKNLLIGVFATLYVVVGTIHLIRQDRHWHARQPYYSLYTGEPWPLWQILWNKIPNFKRFSKPRLSEYLTKQLVEPFFLLGIAGLVYFVAPVEAIWVVSMALAITAKAYFERLSEWFTVQSMIDKEIQGRGYARSRKERFLSSRDCYGAPGVSLYTVAHEFAKSPGQELQTNGVAHVPSQPQPTNKTVQPNWPTQVICPNCSSKLNVPSRKKSSTANCPKCSKAFTLQKT